MPVETTNQEQNIVRRPFIGMSLPHEVIKTDEEYSVIIHFTEVQEKMLEELFDLMGITPHFMLDLAAKYALFYAEKQGVSIYELEEYPKSIGFRPFKYELMMEVESRLEDAGMLDYIPGCAITGLNLLYDRLMKITPKVQTE